MCLQITEKTLSRIVNCSTKNDVETGGLIGSSDGKTIDNYIFDEGQRSSMIEYVPNIDLFNTVLAKWQKDSISFLGIIHSHIADSVLSNKDIQMARKIICCNESIESLLMPLVTMKDRTISWYKVDFECVEQIDVRMLRVI